MMQKHEKQRAHLLVYAISWILLCLRTAQAYLLAQSSHISLDPWVFPTQHKLNLIRLFCSFLVSFTRTHPWPFLHNQISVAVSHTSYAQLFQSILLHGEKHFEEKTKNNSKVFYIKQIDGLKIWSSLQPPNNLIGTRDKIWRTGTTCSIWAALALCFFSLDIYGCVATKESFCIWLCNVGSSRCCGLWVLPCMVRDDSSHSSSLMYESYHPWCMLGRCSFRFHTHSKLHAAHHPFGYGFVATKESCCIWPCNVH